MSEEALVSVKNWLLLVAVAAAAFEGLVLTFVSARSFDWKASLVSFAILGVRFVVEFIPFVFAIPGVFWVYEHRIFNFSIESASGLIVLFFALEFSYYCMHRCSHSVRWLWVTHAVHHSPNELNFSATFRLGWFAKFTFSTIFFAPIALLGFSPIVIASALFTLLVAQVWIHNTWIPRLGPFEYILNTPSAHRVHHARNPEYLNSNFGGLLIIFDRLFGTYRQERKDIEIKYGWSTPFQSYNPVTVELEPIRLLYNDVKGTPGLMNKLALIFAPTGFLADPGDEREPGSGKWQ